MALAWDKDSDSVKDLLRTAYGSLGLTGSPAGTAAYKPVNVKIDASDLERSRQKTEQFKQDLERELAALL
jgi:hypothetical protein